MCILFAAMRHLSRTSRTRHLPNSVDTGECHQYQGTFIWVRKAWSCDIKRATVSSAHALQMFVHGECQDHSARTNHVPGTSTKITICVSDIVRPEPRPCRTPMNLVRTFSSHTPHIQVGHWPQGRDCGFSGARSQSHVHVYWNRDNVSWSRAYLCIT